VKTTSKTLWKAAILTALLTICAAGCATRGKPVVLLDGRHVKSWPKDEAAKVPALADQAQVAKSRVYVASDVGMEMMFNLDVSPVEEKK
jgi:ABC-type cobalamin/Fe3+-siderophores transport system ATPase subunit